MSMKKKIATGALLVAFGATAVTGATLAYFTDSDAKTNEFSIGNVKIALTEPGWDATGKTEAETMYPGEAVAKDPYVTNNGANPAFIRVKVEWPTDVSVMPRTNYVANTIHSEAWTLGEDGYYYYTPNDQKNGNTLAPGATTIKPLFDQIILDTATENGAGKDVLKNIVITAEAVQAQGAQPSWDKEVNGHPAVIQMNAEQIAAWFQTCYEGNIAPAK